MKKINNKGFMLIEILIVSVFVSSVLTVLFVQFKKINNNYKKSFKYDTVEGLYLINNVKNRFITDKEDSGYNFDSFDEFINNDSLKYEDVINPKGVVYNSSNNYFLNLLNESNIKTLLVAKKDAKEEMIKDTKLSIGLRDYIKYMKFKVNNNDYFLIAEFGDGTFASINF